MGDSSPASGNAAATGTLDRGPPSSKLRGCNSVAAEWGRSMTDDIVWDGGATSTSGRVRLAPSASGVAQASPCPSATTASATISSNPDGSVASAAASSVQPSAAVSAGQRRSRASITETSTSSRCTRAPPNRLRPPLRPCACAIGCSHATGSFGVAIRARARLDGSTVLAFGGALRIHTNAVHFVGVVWQRLGGVGGAPVHAQRHSPAQQTADRPLPRNDARAA